MYDSTKLRQYFPTTTVYKDPAVMAIFKSAKIESFLRDWIIKRKADRNGRVQNVNELSEYVASIIPHRSEKDLLEDEARTNGETRPFLARMSVMFHPDANYHSFEIADLGFTHAHTVIEDYVWDRIKGEIIGEAGGWGLIKLGYMPPEGSKKNGRFTLLDYKNFCPYEVSVEAFREARAHFETEEWMDILLGAIDYNADGFTRPSLMAEDVWTAKHTMLTRLLPFIQANLNLIELAPQQTGKSYIFGRLCKYGWLVGGGSISRAKLFLDMRPGAKSAGLVTFHDFVAIDEIKSIKFTNDKEMAGILKTYMEEGRVKVGDANVEGGAGIIFLGNINIEYMDGSRDMFRELPEVFRDTALIQRIHGFVPGRNIPPLSPKMYMNGWALNTEYFTEIMHLLRAPAENMRYRGLIEELVTVGAKADETSGREQEAVMRLCTAYLKLFFPHVNSELIKNPEFKREFTRYCLQPAKRMQETVLKQMQIINPGEFGKRSMSSYKLREE
ncbi:MAG: BREX system Lon protease-like protein BrxL [Treponema sp.]|jgi:ATP-dependent Lon protease|nr:BREX system Lon protease-like protein BrxL [Treponema sp.]